MLPEGPPTPETHLLEGEGMEVPQQPAPSEESTVMLSATTFLDDGAESATVVIDPEDLAAHLTPEPPAATPTPAAAGPPKPVVETPPTETPMEVTTVAEAPTVDEEPPEPAAPPATPTSAIVEAHRRDFIIAYDAAFIGHYRSSRRITNRTAFKNVAKRIAEGFEHFDLRKLELFRPVRLEIDLAVVDESEHDSFHWFAGDSE